MDENRNTENSFGSSASTGVFPDPTAGNDAFSQSENTTEQGVFPEQPVQDFAAQSSAPQQNTAAINNEMPQQSYSNVTTYPAYGEAAKKSKAPIFIIIGAVFLAAVAAVILFMLFGNSQSYEKAERAFVNDVMSALDQVADTNGGKSGEITITPTNALAELLGSDSLNPTTFKTDFSKNDSDMSGSLQFINGTKTILTFKEWISDGRLTVLIPEISSIYLTDNSVDASNASGSVDYETVKKAIDAFLDRYFMIVKDLKPEKDVAVEAGGITGKCDVYTIEVDQLFKSRIQLALLETLQEYPEIADFLTRYSDGDLDEDEIAEQIEECQSDITYYKENGCEKTGELMAYVAGGKIVGREFTSIDGSGSSRYLCLESGNSYAAEFTSTADGSNVTVTNAGAVSENGSAGTISFESSSTDIDKVTVTVDYSDFKLTDNHLTGNVTVSSPTAALNIDGVFSYDGSTDNAVFDVFVAGTNYGSISFSSTATDSKPETTPELNSENSCTIDDDDPNAEKFGADFSSFISDIDARFADENGNYEVVYGSLKGIFSILFYGNSYDSDDNYDDDWDYNYDDDDDNSDTSLSAEDRKTIEDYISKMEQYIKSDGSFDIDKYIENTGLGTDLEGMENVYAEFFLLTIDTYRDVLDGKITLDEAEYIIENYFGESYDDNDDDYDYDDDYGYDEGYDGSSNYYDSYISADDITVTINGSGYKGAVPFTAYEDLFPSISSDEFDEYDGAYSKYYSNDDYTLSISGYYYGDNNPPAVKDSSIYSIYCYEGCDKKYAISINGITLGSSEEELLKALPDPSYASVSDYGTYYSYDTEDYSLSATFAVADGYVVSLGYLCY